MIKVGLWLRNDHNPTLIKGMPKTGATR